MISKYDNLQEFFLELYVLFACVCVCVCFGDVDIFKIYFY